MKLDKLAIDELVAIFVSSSEQQYELILDDEINKYNRLVEKQDEIIKELRKRGVEARLELTKLFDHPNIQVRLNAARRSIGVAREPALNVLRQIVKEDFGPFRLDAGMTVALVEDGTIIPT
jgi:plasmid replication initiation protein